MSSIIGKRAYKTSRVPHIDSIPSNWSESKIKHVASVNPSLNAIIDDDKPVGYVPMECVKNGYMEPYTALKSELSTGLTVFQNGDIVLAKVTPCFENGNIAIAFNLKQNVGFGSSELFVFRAHGISTKYLFYFLQTSGFMADGVESMTGAAGLKRVSPILVKNYVLPVPPMDEQDAIVSYIEAHVRNVNEAISRSKAIIEKLIEYRKSVITQAVTKGISHSVSFVDSGTKWIGQIPSHWMVIDLKRVANIQTGNTPSKKDGNDNFSDSSGIPWIKPENLDYFEPIHNTNEYLTPTGVELGRVFEPYSIFVCCIASIGKVGYSDVSCSCNQQINALHFDEKVLFWKYGFYALRASAIEHIAKANVSVQSILNATSQGYIKIPVPKTLDEQHDIVNYLDNKCQKIANAIERQQTIIEKLEEYKKSLIYNAVTGKIDCRKET